MSISTDPPRSGPWRPPGEACRFAFFPAAWVLPEHSFPLQLWALGKTPVRKEGVHGEEPPVVHLGREHRALARGTFLGVPMGLSG